MKTATIVIGAAALLLMTRCVTDVRCPQRKVSSDLSLDVIMSRSPALTLFLTFENHGVHPLRLSETFGYQSTWLALEIKDAEGKSIPYPSDLPEVSLARPPNHFCLQPGKQWVWPINLLAWNRLYGGRSDHRKYAFALPPGSYRIRARYANECASIICPEDTVVSEWAEFHVP